MKRCFNAEIVTHRLESSVLSIMSDIMTDESKLKNHLAGFGAEKSSTKIETENQLKNMAEKILNLKNGKQNTLERYAEGKINRSAYSQKCREYDAEISQAKNERDQLLTAIPSLHKKDIVDASLEQYCSALRTRLYKCNDFDLKRRLLLDYIQQVVFTNGRIEMCGSVPIQLDAYADPDQSSEAREIKFSIPREE